MQQGTADWLEMRRNYIGASDAPVLMGFYNWGRTPKKLWEEKLGLGEDQADNSAMKYGRNMEEPARLMYQEMTGIEVEPDIVFHKEKNFLMASLDGINKDRSMGVEIKNVCLEDHLVAKDNKVPPKYYPQVMQQMACTGLDRWHYFSVNNGDKALVEVKMCNDYIEQLYNAEDKFWDQVKNFIEPDLVEADLRGRDENWVKAALRAYDIKKSISLLKKEEIEATNTLKTLSEGKSSVGGSYIFKKTSASGTINYKSIPELKDVDLEIYRNPPQERWTLTKKK